MPSVLVLGCGGMLGRAVYTRLAAQPNWRVVGTQRCAEAGMTSLHAGDGVGLRRLLALEPFDLAINCIGVLKSQTDEGDGASIASAIEVNALFPHVLASAAAEFGTSVLHVSTDGVFSGLSDRPYLEDSPVDALDHYGKTKALGESRAEHVLNLRCSIIGRSPQKRRGLIEWFLGLADGASVTGYEGARWNGVSTLQVAVLCERIVEQDRFRALRTISSVHHFCPNAPTTKYDLIGLLNELTGNRVVVTRDTRMRFGMARVLGTQYAELAGLYPSGDDWASILRALLVEDDGRRSRPR